jgi:hypothetical protein
MNLIKFLDEFTSENLAKKGASRRDAFSTFSSLGKKAAIAAVPFGMAAASNKAKAATMFQSDDAVNALQLALTLEYLEASLIDFNLTKKIPSVQYLYNYYLKHLV